MASQGSFRSCAGHEGGVDLDRDRALVRRCQDGDGAAFAELYTEYHDRLRRLCVRRLTDRDEADEVTQEAFLRAWRALPTFGGDLRFYPWLTVIAKNLCADLLRRRARCIVVQDLDRSPGTEMTGTDPVTIAMSSEEAVMAAYEGALAAEAMTRLSERHRNVLLLREEAGLSYQEIATLNGVEVSTVETLLWRARKALKREYAALSESKVLAGLAVAGGALRRLAGRLGRPGVRLAQLAENLRPRDVLAACVVTATLATVSAVPTLTWSSPARPVSGPVTTVQQRPAPTATTDARGAQPRPIADPSPTLTTVPTPPPAPSPAADGGRLSTPALAASSLTLTPASAPAPPAADGGRLSTPALGVSGATPTPAPVPVPTRAATTVSLPAVIGQLPALPEEVLSTVADVAQPVVATVTGLVQVAPLGSVLSLLRLG